jgi:hypothetical protein
MSALSTLSEESRKEIFLALVQAQDQNMGVLQSRGYIRERFGLTDRQVRKIEDEGLDKQWPPLTSDEPLPAGLQSAEEHAESALPTVLPDTALIHE